MVHSCETGYKFSRQAVLKSSFEWATYFQITKFLLRLLKHLRCNSNSLSKHNLNHEWMLCTLLKTDQTSTWDIFLTFLIMTYVDFNETDLILEAKWCNTNLISSWIMLSYPKLHLQFLSILLVLLTASWCNEI